MASRPTRQVPAAAASAVAEQMERDCRALAQCLAELAASPPDQFEDCCARSLRQAQSLRASISAAAAELRRARAASGPLAPEVRGELDARIRDIGHLLAQAASGYSSAAHRITGLLEEVRQQLLDVQRGGRILRSYADAARDR